MNGERYEVDKSFERRSLEMEIDREGGNRKHRNDGGDNRTAAQGIGVGANSRHLGTIWPALIELSAIDPCDALELRLESSSIGLPE